MTGGLHCLANDRFLRQTIFAGKIQQLDLDTYDQLCAPVVVNAYIWSALYEPYLLIESKTELTLSIRTGFFGMVSKWGVAMKRVLLTLVASGIFVGHSFADNRDPDLSNYLIDRSGAESPEAFSSGYAFALWLHTTDLKSGGFNSMDLQVLSDAKKEMAYVISDWSDLMATGYKQVCIDQVFDRSLDQIDPVAVVTEITKVTSIEEERADEIYRRVLTSLTDLVRQDVERKYVASVIGNTVVREPDAFALAIDYPDFSRSMFYEACNSIDVDLYANKKTTSREKTKSGGTIVKTTTE